MTSLIIEARVSSYEVESMLRRQQFPCILVRGYSVYLDKQINIVKLEQR